MILYIYEKIGGSDSLSPVTIIDNASSVIWVERYNDAGEFEIHMKATPEIVNLFLTEKYIMRDDKTAAMISEKIQITTDPVNGNYITITGRSAESLLGRRVVNRVVNYTSDVNVESVMRNLYRSFVGDQAGSDRQISIITLGSSAGLTATIPRKQITGANVLGAISGLAKQFNYGFRLKWDKENGVFIYEVYAGKDRSYGNAINPPVTFSPNFENLGNTSYSNDRTETYNFAYVAGEGEGGARTIVTTPTQSIPTGLTRRECWVDAHNTSKGSMTDAQYTAALQAEGNETLAESQDTAEFSGEVLNYGMYKYGEDYYLGDRVQVENEYGIAGKAYVTEVTEVEDENGYKMYPTLSQWEQV